MIEPRDQFELDSVDGDAGSSERFGVRLLRPPPAPAMVFGAMYGVIAGLIIVYDVVVLIRLGKVVGPKVSKQVRRARRAVMDEA